MASANDEYHWVKLWVKRSGRRSFLELTTLAEDPSLDQLEVFIASHPDFSNWSTDIRRLLATFLYR